jgi:type I restriction enzyme S subunit
MTEWQTLPLGETLTFQRGFDITKEEQRGGPYPVISSSGPKSLHAEYKVTGPGVIIGRKGSLGTVFYSDGNYWPHDTTLWIKDFHGNDPRFAYYFLQTMGFERLDVGASNPSLNRNHIHTIPVLWPPFPVQQRIAGILFAYDELIENSQRRIKILEAMARGLYREWFVHFRFPGHENHSRVASALGEIPQGWAVKKVGDLVEFKKGKKPTAVFESAESGLKRHLLIDALRGGSSLEFVMPDKLISTTVDDTIMVMDGSGSGDVFIGYEGVIGSTLGRYRVVDVSDGGPFWLFLFLDTHLEEIKSKNIGSAIPHANKDFINGMSVAVAPKSVLLNFEKAVTPMFGLIRSLRSKTDALRRTRDLLLPRLLSGQIEVGGT